MARPKISELRKEIAELRKAGSQMSNLCFNEGQRSERDDRNAEIKKQLCIEWDAIKRTEFSK